MADSKGPQALAFLRVIVGVWLVWLVLPYLDRSFIERLPFFLEDMARTNPWDAYRWLIHQLAMPHVDKVGIAVLVGPLMMGIALIIGFLTRFTASVGLFYVLNLYLAAGHLSMFHQGLAMILGMVCLTLILSDAGRFYGVDGFLFKQPSSDSPAKSQKYKNKKQKAVVDQLNRQVKQKSAGKKQKEPAGKKIG